MQTVAHGDRRIIAAQPNHQPHPRDASHRPYASCCPLPVPTPDPVPTLISKAAPSTTHLDPGVIIAIIPIVAIPRGGLLALIATHVTVFLGHALAVGTDWSHWFTAPTLIPASVLAALLFLSARAASDATKVRSPLLAGKPSE